MVPDDELLPPSLKPIAEAFAVEGIPVNAIARGLRQPASLVWNTLEEARQVGKIVELPPPDWPPTARAADRLPYRTTATVADSLLVASRKEYKLTNLEANFFAVLMANDNASKEKLHKVVGRERQKRNPAAEDTDEKMVDVIICKLRKKIEPVGIKIQTIWGHGYFIAPEVRGRVLTELGIVGSGHAPPQ